MRTITESFHDTTNSLELTKEKMLHMVPSAVHVALKERYQKVTLFDQTQTSAWLPTSLAV